MVDKDVEWWTDTAKHVYRQLREVGLDQGEAAELAQSVLAEIGRDRRTEQIGEQRRSSGEEPGEDWRSKPVSKRQKEVLMREGYTEEQLEEMTRGDASDELDDILGEED